jgi:sirohydrochlorin ferrochelatase
MSSAAVLLGHGSPDPAGQAELCSLGALVGRRLGFEVGLGVLEFQTATLPGLEAAFAAVEDRQRVAAQPLVLFDGVHGRHDIPAAAASATTRLGVEVRLGSALGCDPALIGLTVARLSERGLSAGDVLLFVGRGSSQPLARAQTEEIAGAVAAEFGVDHVVCYAGISRPSLGEGIEAAVGRGPRRVLALPYLLHTGVLVRRVRKILTPLAERQATELVVLPHIGNAPELVELVATRLGSLL